MKIMIVEDVRANMVLMTRVLEELLPGAEIFKAENGVEAVKIASNNKLEMIIMDIQMPGMDGLEATRRIRRLDQHLNTPILALSAGVMQNEKELCYQAGMQGFLSKPLQIDQLEQLLDDFLGITKNRLIN